MDFRSLLPPSPPQTRRCGCDGAARHRRRHVTRVAAQDGRRGSLAQTLTATTAAGGGGRTHIFLAKEKKEPHHQTPAAPPLGQSAELGVGGALQVEDGSRG